jgi:hypothetical protein
MGDEVVLLIISHHNCRGEDTSARRVEVLPHTDSENSQVELQDCEQGL